MSLIKPIMWTVIQSGRPSPVHFIRVGSGDPYPLCHIMWASANVEVISPEEFTSKVEEFGLCKACSRSKEGRAWILDNHLRSSRPKVPKVSNRIVVSNLRQDAVEIISIMQSGMFTDEEKVWRIEKLARDLRDRLQELERNMAEELL